MGHRKVKEEGRRRSNPKTIAKFCFLRIPKHFASSIGTDGRRATVSAGLITSSLGSFDTKLSQAMPRKQLKHVTQQNFQQLKRVNWKNDHQCKIKLGASI